jgi:hypothetical protein
MSGLLEPGDLRNGTNQGFEKRDGWIIRTKIENEGFVDDYDIESRVNCFGNEEVQHLDEATVKE